MLDKAICIAAEAHKGQKDKAGEPYILHTLRVMLSRQGETEMICAVLHDVVEDTDVTFDYLESQGFSKEVLDALDALTRRDNEPYEDFIKRVAENKVACYVKLSDLRDNMDLSRIPNPTQKDHQRVEKYRKAVGRILEALDSYSESSQE